MYVCLINFQCLIFSMGYVLLFFYIRAHKIWQKQKKDWWKKNVQTLRRTLKGQCVALCTPQTGSLERRWQKNKKHVEVWNFFSKWWSQDYRINNDTNQAKVNIITFVPTNLIHCILQPYPPATHLFNNVEHKLNPFSFNVYFSCHLCLHAVRGKWQSVKIYDIILGVIHISTPALARRWWGLSHHLR